MFMDKFLALIFMAILVEAIISYTQEIKTIKSPLIWSILLGVLVAVVYGIDLPNLLGIYAKIPFIGEILTGIIMARGSNYLYDLIGRFTNLKDKPIVEITSNDKLNK